MNIKRRRRRKKRKRIARALLNARKAKKYKTIDMASRAGIYYNHLKLIEAGYVFPEPYMLEYIAKAYDIDLDKLTRLTEQNRKAQKFLLKHPLTLRVIKISFASALLGIIATIIALIASSTNIVVNAPQISQLYQKPPSLLQTSLLYLPLFEDTFESYPNMNIYYADQSRNSYAYSKAIEYTNLGLAEELEKKDTDSEVIRKIKTTLGSLYFIIGDFENAIKCYSEALLLVDGTSVASGLIYTNLAQIYTQLGQTDQAKTYYVYALETDICDSEYYVSFLCKYAMRYIVYKDYDSAEFLLTAANQRFDFEESIYNVGAERATKREESNMLEYLIGFMTLNSKYYTDLFSDEDSISLMTDEEFMDNYYGLLNANDCFSGALEMFDIDILSKLNIYNIMIYNYRYLGDFIAAEEMNDKCQSLIQLYLPEYPVAYYRAKLTEIWLLCEQNNLWDAKNNANDLLDLWQKKNVWNLDLYYELAGIFSRKDNLFEVEILNSIEDNHLNSADSISKHADIGFIYHFMIHNIDKAIEHYKIAINIAEISNNSDDSTMVLQFMLPVLYFENHQDVLALTQCEEIIKRYNIEYQDPYEDKQKYLTLLQDEFGEEYEITDLFNGIFYFVDGEKSCVAYSISRMFHFIYIRSGEPEKQFKTWWQNAYNQGISKE